jgi:predicted 3-demethylubiquinone-9 3-methyltransferase (glyoxalase superfamily)
VIGLEAAAKDCLTYQDGNAKPSKERDFMQKLSTCLWFDGKAEEAVNFYTSIFKNSKKGKISRYGEGAPMPKGTVMVATFELLGHEFMALNGGPQFSFTPAISLVVHCDTQEEIDEYWKKLIEGGGEEVQCGWLKDKYGISWQIVPAILGDLMSDKDATKTQRVMQALLQMKKLDIQKLRQAKNGQ